MVVKNPTANAEDAEDSGSIPGSGRFPGGGNATHSSIFVWEIPWTGEPGKLQSLWVPKSQTRLSTHITLCKLLYNNLPLNLVPCFGLRAPVLQTLYFWYVHNKLKLIWLFPWFTGFTSAFFLNFWQFTASEVESRENPQWRQGRWATGARTQSPPCLLPSHGPGVWGVGLSDLSSPLLAFWVLRRDCAQWLSVSVCVSFFRSLTRRGETCDSPGV